MLLKNTLQWFHGGLLLRKSASEIFFKKRFLKEFRNFCDVNPISKISQMFSVMLHECNSWPRVILTDIGDAYFQGKASESSAFGNYIMYL